MNTKRTSTRENLKVGSFKVTIPKRVVKKPFVIGFTTLERDNDPRKRLYIESSIVGQKLSRTIKIKVNVGELPDSKTLDDYEFKYGKEYLQPKVLKSGFVQIRSNTLENSFQVRDQNPLRKHLLQNSNLRSSNISQNSSEFSANSALLQSTHPTNECISQLSSLSTSIENLIAQGNHNVYSDVCEDLYPYIWATFTDLTNVPNLELSYPWYAQYVDIKVEESRADGTIPENLILKGYDLHTINDLVNDSGAAIAVNGGFWYGDEARFYNPVPVGGL